MIAALLLASAMAASPGCAVDADCAVDGARCEEGRCRLAVPVSLFPLRADLSPISLVSPADLASAPPTPDFYFEYPVGADLVAIAIFRRPPAWDPREPLRIAGFNPESVAWIWHSNLPAGAGASSVSFAQGRELLKSPGGSDEATLSQTEPDELTPGVYFWAAWGWTGEALTHRSAVRSFVVGDENVSGTACADHLCPGPTTARCLPTKLRCVLACASDADCFRGYVCDLEPLTSNRRPFGICRRPDAQCGCGSGPCDPDLLTCPPEPVFPPSSAGCGCTAGVADDGLAGACAALAALAFLARPGGARRRR